MKKFLIPAMFGIVFILAVALSGCGDPPLQDAYEDMNELKSAQAEIFYDSSKDLLQVSLYEGADLDAIFEKLEEAVKDQEVGGIFFKTKFTTGQDFIKKYAEKIGKLPVKSMSLLGIGQEMGDYSEGKWTGLLSKADILYVQALFTVNEYKGEAKKDLEKVKKIWTSDNSFSYIGTFPEAEEIGVSVALEMTADPSKEEEDSGEDTDSDTDTDSDNSTDSENADSDTEEAAYSFDYSFTDAGSFTPLKKLKNLDHILISPTAKSYTLTSGGAGYIFALSNVRPNVRINEPGKELDKANLIKVKNVDVSEMDTDPYLRSRILESFLKPEVKKVYKRAIKFKKSSKTPKIRGKALVYMAEPPTSEWSSSRRYSDSGRLLDSDELGTRVKTPAKAGDYQTFIYAYPVYTYKANYTSGTKGYTETYKVQVFDLKKKRAYESQTVASKDPPYSFRYPKGSPPDKKSGEVSDKKVYKFIKHIKKRK